MKHAAPRCVARVGSDEYVTRLVDSGFRVVVLSVPADDRRAEQEQ